MKKIVEILLVEHERIWGYLREAEATIRRLLEPKDYTFPEASMEVLKSAAELGLRISIIAGMFSEHESLEDSTVYPQLEQLGYREEVKKLRDQHRRLKSIVDDAVLTVRAYKRGEVDLRGMTQRLLDLHMKLARIVDEHFKLEEQVFERAFKPGAKPSS